MALFAVSLVAFPTSFFHIAWYDAGPSPQTVILRRGVLDAWNGGAYYRPGISANGPDWLLDLWPREPIVSTMQLGGGAGTMWRLHLPLWMPLAGFGLPAAALALADRKRQKRLRTTMCVCGYDLTGLAASRCPECNAVIRPPA